MQFGSVWANHEKGGELGIFLQPPSSQSLCTSTELSCINKVWDEQCILADTHSTLFGNFHIILIFI